VDHKAFPDRESFDAELARVIDGFEPDLVVLAGFMRILTPAFTARYEGRMLNIHPSLLPSFPGLHTHQRAIDMGCKVAGCTVHFVTAELDHGPIVAQGVVPVLDDDFVAVGPRDAATAAARASARWLAARPLVLFEPGANTRRLIDEWFARAGVRARPVMELGNVEAIKELVAAGLGWSVLPALSVRTPSRRRQLAVLPLAPRLQRQLAWVLRRDKPLNRALRQVNDAVLGLRAAGV